jgi:hypothetical protein
VDVSTTTVDTTAAVTIDITGQLSVADAANQLELLYVSMIHHRRQ